MAGLEDMFKNGGNIVTGLAIGLGAVVVAPLILPVLRPIAKSALKVGIAAYDQGRVMLSEMNEQFEDVMAEARAEIEEERTGHNGGTHPSSRKKVGEHETKHEPKAA